MIGTMDKRKELLIKMTETEFDGRSFNAPPMRKLLSTLPFTQVIRTDTFENYSVWSVALHCMYWKFDLADKLGAQKTPFGYEEKNFPALPDPADENAWKLTLESSISLHRRYIQTLTDFPDNKLDTIMPGWKCPYIDAIAWMATHDTYHVAQIRNMGIEIPA